MIAVIDYGAGNLQSVVKAFHFIGCDILVTADKEELKHASAAVLPGVGAFGDAMSCLKKADFVTPVLDFIESGKPFLGICLGLQLLFEGSEETPGISGLGVLKGKIQKIPAETGLKIPHIGWNSLSVKENSGLFQNMDPNPYVYFVHSYYLKAEDPGVVSSTTDYGVAIDASVQRGNLFATQFHPEKSGKTGLQMLKNFVSFVS
ncbi:imidazole glycerol phosphate synthase subunit HisH [Caproiciproducens sp. CPB-2]|uniref:imidazole glycerol phosphate synthase subunit HisH n=1 Tax=Caproiciproducens sp. CPB-2 TaxID=3030017 RepID=UPI0023DB1B65|nr:imidazole glycerol phosphate synthase subunit HisH [Caproiciproducens sp. CPB-2]MDF1495040.1 imidazole glycerol phosphate synthase subunit HisH [Caproiciproducens sp. CPB-2]